MTMTEIIFKVLREGCSKEFKDRDIAKAVYKEWKRDYPETVLYKIITEVKSLQFDSKSECWL